MRPRHHARFRLNQVDSEIHLQPGESLLHAILQPRAVNLGIFRFHRVGVDPDAIAEFSAHHLVHRHVVGFARQVPQRHLDPAHAAGLPRVKTELLDLPENLVDVAGILAQDAALEHQRVILGSTVAHFTQSVNALVGIDANHRAPHGRARYRRHAQVRDLEIVRPRCGVGVLHEGIERLVGPESGGGNGRAGFQKSSARRSAGMFHVPPA